MARSSSQLDTNTVILIGGGSLLLAAIIYGIYELGQAKDAITATNDQIAQSTSAAQDITNQATAAAGQVSGSINQATQAAQQAQQNPLVVAGNNLANWWNSL